MPFSLALGVSFGIALLGVTARALTRAGGLTATLVGSLILWRTGWPGMAGLGAFFVGSSLISRIAPDRSVTALDAKGSTRDSWQVLANGGGAALAAVLPVPAEAALWMVTASLAAAAADTWATSTGGWSRIDPRHILTGRTVPAGTSGGVTLLGSGGALIGAATVGGATALVAGRLPLFWLGLIVGPLGMLLDSVIGSVWQGRFRCAQCDRLSERQIHRCGTRTELVGGRSWITNDGVNALATTFSALLGYGLWVGL